MKPFSVHPASCSCTSCVYRSRSKDPKVQQIIQGGTDIDKLYYGKYLPLRERKLLEKLIRTRDVYDDVRNQLLSSASSDQTSLEHKRERRDDISIDKSSAVMKMVDLVDRGQMGSANASKFSSCCSCCSCEALRKIRKRMEKEEHKHPRVYRHIVTCEDIAKYCAEAEEKGRKRRNKLSTKISSKLSSKIGATRLKMKKNLSEPCACSLSLSSIATRSSKALKKYRSKKKVTESARARKVMIIDQETKIAKIPRKPRNKVKNIQSSTTQESGTEMISLKTFKIKKDSILLFKEKLLKKRTYKENQDVECEPGTCNTDECIPEECLRKIKAKGVGDMRKRKHHTRHTETGRDRFHISMSSRTKKVKARNSRVQDEPTSKSSYSITTILKTKIVPSFSKSEIKGKKSVSTKQRQQFEKATGKQDKAYKKTKSATSMTSIPKSKAKAQLAMKEEKVAPKVKPKAKLQLVAKDNRLEEKGIRVQVSPESNLATCECKLSTKSTASLTSVSKQKTSKSHSKRIKSHEVASQPTRHKRDRQKLRRESYQNVEKADLEEPIEHVKAKREKRMKPTQSRIKQRRKHKYSNTQFTGTLSKASQESYLRESASPTNNLPFTRECEPLMCIPYECDPEKCAQILLSRSKSRGKSVTTGMDRLRRKSVGSAAFSQKTSQKTSSRSRTKYKQSKSAENFIRKPKYGTEKPPPQIVEKSSPGRQAVKITSSFSFDIEFYKDRYPCVKDDEKKDLVSGHQKKHRRKYKDHGTGYISSRQNISCQSRSSESFKNIQVGHRLKRCFCTLKLLPKKKQTLKHAVLKRTMTFYNKELDMGPRKKRTQTKPSGIAYVVPPATSNQASLLPYECEPFFCTLGECNPYECAERIKQRNRRAARHVSKDTNTTVTPKKSKLAFTSQSVSKSTSRPIHPCDCHSQSSNVESKVAGDKSERQATRIGSNFNFNIEFSKTNLNDQERADTLKSDKSIKRERRHFREKGIKVYKPHVRDDTSETNKYVKTKQIYNEPFLQRCLCTLKLLKKNKKKVETISPWRNRNEYVMHLQKKSVTTNRAEVRYNHEQSKVLPKECDPYNCEKLIKLRHMILQHKYSNIFFGDLGSRSTFSKTLRAVSSKSQNTQSFTKECPQKVKKRNQDYNEINIMPSRSKQRIMRVGSKMSLKLSRCKSKVNYITTEHLINKHTHNKDKLTEAKCKEKESYVFSAIKRCFSTFKFQNKRNKAGLENNDVISKSRKTSYPLPNSQICEDKSTRTRLSKIPYGLNSYKCVPNFFIPAKCDPYESYEESKQHEFKGLHDYYVSTDRDRRERKLVRSVTTSDFSGSTMANNTKSRLLNRKTKIYQKLRNKQRDIKAARSFSPSRQVARKGSNLSFNKEISKHRFVPSIRDTTIKNQVEKYNTVSDISTVSRMTDKGTKHKRVALKHDISQANEIRKEVKASNVGFLLKRCFCTLGLQKKNKPKTELRWHQPITTQFVQVEQNRHNIAKPGCKVLNKTLYGGEPLKLKLPEGDHLFKENLIRNQSAKQLSNSRSFSRRAHVRSRFEFNFDKMRCLLNTQKINPFYRSFYALNVNVSKSKNMPHNKYRALNDNERKPSECPPNECDPVDCSKKVKRLNRSMASDTTSLDSELSCYKRFKLEKHKKSKKPDTFGSDLTIRAEVYKDTDPHKNSRSQALRLGSDVRLNFDFYKESPSHGFWRTGLKPYHDRKEATRSHPRPADLQAYGVKDKPKNKSSTLVSKSLITSLVSNKSLKSEKRERSLKARSAQCDCLQQQRNKYHKPGRNNVRFCTNVNCVEFYNDRTQKQTKSNRLQGRGEGDIGKQKGPVENKNTKKPENENEGKKKKLNKLIGKCCCTLQHLKGQKKGKYLTSKQSMEIIGERKKKSKLPEEAEKSMETIMPYSKKKFKKLDSRSKLTKGTNENTKQNQQMVCPICDRLCHANTMSIKPESKKKKILFGFRSKLTKGTNENTKQNQQMVCPICEIQCPGNTMLIKPDVKKKIKNLYDQLKHTQVTNQTQNPSIDQYPQGVCEDCINYIRPKTRKCPVCTAIAAGKFIKTKKKLPCTCDQDLGQKKKYIQSKIKPPPIFKSDKKVPKMPAKAVVDNTPLFNMTVNKTNMKIINKNDVLTNLGSSGKESRAMKKARAAIKKGNVDPPVIKMIIDSKDASIINAEQVMTRINDPNILKKGKTFIPGLKIKVPKVTGKKGKVLEPATEPSSTSKTTKLAKKERRALAKSHGSKCKCCICRGMKKGKKPPGVQTSKQFRKLRPCVCGSVLCKKDWDRIDHEQKSQAAVKFKKCVCGSNICDEESSKMPELLLEGARQAQREKDMAKRSVKKEKMYQKAKKRRAKDKKKDLVNEIKIRSIQDKRAMKTIKKSESQGDLHFIAESLIDLGTFGSKAFCDIASSLCRAIMYPRDALSGVREAISDPGTAAQVLRAKAEGLGLFSTLSRIKERIARMPTTKKVVTTMEGYPSTNYLIHMADTDPKKRMKKFKSKRMKEQRDFQCSIYMASMRKRPCLRVYRMCPWFYPHCMSLLNIWKQLMDILLFLSAVLVWSPCILCMELCRGCVCCCMCQG